MISESTFQLREPNELTNIYVHYYAMSQKHITNIRDLQSSDCMSSLCFQSLSSVMCKYAHVSEYYKIMH
jgi:hypothetical protein